MSYNTESVSTLKQVAVVVPCFIMGCVGALALTAPQQSAAVYNRVIPTQAATAVGATVAAATLANPAMALNSIEFKDMRAAKDGVMITYEARDATQTQDVRSGFAEARDPEFARTRFAESSARFSNIGVSVSKKYWTEGREELRRQVGYMRFDINTLAASKSGAASKAKILAAKKDLFETVDKLDFAMRMKDQASATKLFADTAAKVDAVGALLA